MLESAQKLKKLREKYGYTQEQLADFLHVSQSSYSRLETGEGKLNLEQIDKLAEAYEMDIVSFLHYLTDDKRFSVNHSGDNNSQGEISGNNYVENITINNSFSKEEKELYQKQIQKLEEEIAFLREMLKDKLK
ncbi:MAG: helix-turn-helix domain-containing protein [Raineya sp.]|jgi:transcriptional regulator with XRE-family HTH domain|nr:helix-turn-helix domain-containing protein [Raineya sp.]